MVLNFVSTFPAVKVIICIGIYYIYIVFVLAYKSLMADIVSRPGIFVIPDAFLGISLHIYTLLVLNGVIFR